MSKKANVRQVRLPRNAAKRLAVSASLDNDVQVVTHMTAEEIAEFWNDPCWADPNDDYMSILDR